MLNNSNDSHTPLIFHSPDRRIAHLQPKDFLLFQCLSAIFICSTLIPPFPPPLLLPSCIFTAPLDKGLNLWHKVKDIRGEHQTDNRAPPSHLFAPRLLWRLKLFRWKMKISANPDGCSWTIKCTLWNISCPGWLFDAAANPVHGTSSGCSLKTLHAQ